MKPQGVIELERAAQNAPARAQGARLEDVEFLYARVSAEFVTFSVFGQIDTVSWDRMQPIARVQPPMAGRYAIGSDRDGLLVKGSFDADWSHMPSAAFFRAEALTRLRVLRQRADPDPAEVERLTRIETDLPRYEAALEGYMALPLLLLAREPKKRDIE